MNIIVEPPDICLGVQFAITVKANTEKCCFGADVLRDSLLAWITVLGQVENIDVVGTVNTRKFSKGMC